MWRVVFAFIFLLSSTLYADELIPGSYTIEYGGVYKVIIREANRFLEGQWRDQERLRYVEGEIGFFEFSRRQVGITNFLNDWRHGPPWWTRQWWDSFEPESGGAPPNHSIKVKCGETHQLLETIVFSFNNAFELKWKSLEASVDFSREQTITVGMELEPPRIGWKFKFSPIFDISSRKLLTKPIEALNRIGLGIGASHVVRGNEILSLDIQVGYNPTKRETFIGAYIALIRW